MLNSLDLPPLFAHGARRDRVWNREDTTSVRADSA